MKKILFFLLFISGVSFSQTLTLPELLQLKNMPIYDHIQLSDAQIVYPVTGLTSIKVKQEYSPRGEIKYLEIELWIVDARGKIVYSYITTSTDLKNQTVDRDYERYMNSQGHHMMHKML